MVVWSKLDQWEWSNGSISFKLYFHSSWYSTKIQYNCENGRLKYLNKYLYLNKTLPFCIYRNERNTVLSITLSVAMIHEISHKCLMNHTVQIWIDKNKFASLLTENILQYLKWLIESNFKSRVVKWKNHARMQQI